MRLFFYYYLLVTFLFIFIANISHVQYQIGKKNKNDYLYNQISSSMNYETSEITRFFCFGVDIQIEHHLFPNIPHSSLRKIKHVVRDYCSKHNIPYIEKQNIFSVIYSFTQYLYNMGNLIQNENNTE